MLAIRYGVEYPFLKFNGFEFQFPLFKFILLILSVVLIAAGGYAINDYFDRKIDLLNRPDRVVVGTHFDSRNAMTIHNLFTFIGLMIGLYLSYDIGHLNFSFIFAIITGALWFYSTIYKRQLIVGNIIIAILTAIVPFMVLLYDLPLINQYYNLVFVKNPQYVIEMRYMMYAVFIFSGFAFLSTLVREIIKDMEDANGDEAFNRRTIPIAWGNAVAKSIAIVLIIATIVSLALIYFVFTQNMLSLIYLLVFLIAPMFALIYFLIKANDAKDFLFCSQLQKIIMLIGLLYVIPFALTIMNII
jgi:4-hydroxybenzoate polyprenyltransferase